MTHSSRRELIVHDAGGQTTVQDAGRPGHAALGVSPSGACDRGAWSLGNRLVGNARGAASLEVVLGGLVVSARVDLVVAVTGARCSDTPHNAPFTLRAGEELRLGRPAAGLRTYVAVRGGIAVEAVLGSRSTDLLSGLGPAPLSAGDVIPVGPAEAEPPEVELAPVEDPPGGTLQVRVTAGPRRDWFTEAAWRSLLDEPFVAGPDSNRVGVRLRGPQLERSRSDELASEGLVRGALQVPASGEPVVFLADHPVTGGYPVIAVVDDRDLDRIAQLRPGQAVVFRPS